MKATTISQGCLCCLVASSSFSIMRSSLTIGDQHGYLRADIAPPAIRADTGKGDVDDYGFSHSTHTSASLRIPTTPI